MGQANCSETQVKRVNAITDREAFAATNNLRLHFKVVYEHKGLRAYWDKHVVIKVKVQLCSDSSSEKWFLTESEFQEVAALLMGESEAPRRTWHKRECELCNEGIIERRYPGCQHGFCSACIRRWMAEHDTCPYCRLENPGNAEQRRERLMLSMSVAAGTNVRTALAIICHRF